MKDTTLMQFNVAITKAHNAALSIKVDLPDDAWLSSNEAYGGWNCFFLLARAWALAAAMAPTFP